MKPEARVKLGSLLAAIASSRIGSPARTVLLTRQINKKSLQLGPYQVPRAGWYECYDSSMDEDPFGELPADADDQDWTW